MTYIVYTAYGSYSVLKEEFDAKNFIGANVFDPESGEMFIVADGTLISLSKEEVVETPTESEDEIPPAEEPKVEVPAESETPVESEESTEPEVEKTPSEEEITE